MRYTVTFTAETDDPTMLNNLIGDVTTDYFDTAPQAYGVTVGAVSTRLVA